MARWLIPRFGGVWTLLLVASLACDDSTSPVLANRVFVLRTVGGQELPAPYMTGVDTERLVADTIHFLSARTSRGTAYLRHGAVYELPSGPNRRVAYDEEYELVGAILRFIPPPCPQSQGRAVDCFYAEREGRLSDNELTITFHDTLFRPQRFVRIR